MGVEREWYVKKQASKSFNVGPVGIRYIGYLQFQWNEMNNMFYKAINNMEMANIYHATETQLAGWISQLLKVFKPGYW